MVILGIDPGTHRVGYGFIESEQGECRYLAAGLLAVGRAQPHAQLQKIKQELDSLIHTFSPEALALEKLYFTKNQRTGISVAQARGVILLAAAEHSLPVAEFGPSELKAHLTGYGSADKAAVFKMVKLSLRCPTLDVIDDASDALALALVAHFTKSFA
ncbi:MAG: crossover junction endodeoxyribonuclease RuvC [Candidatus Liptonbacteria bacterium]|nr:crossover junction endodeoxyribonuclease RuvC [Candidatus Liptonbacteria bacterium]